MQTHKRRDGPANTRDTKKQPWVDEKFPLDIKIAYGRLAPHLYALHLLSHRQDKDSVMAKQLDGLFVRNRAKIEDPSTGILVKCAKLELKHFDLLTDDQKTFVARVLNEYAASSDDPVHRLSQRPLNEILGLLAGMLLDMEEAGQLPARSFEQPSAVPSLGVSLPSITRNAPAEAQADFERVVERVHELKVLMGLNGGVDLDKLHSIVSAEFPHNKMSPGLVAYVADNY